MEYLFVMLLVALGSATACPTSCTCSDYTNVCYTMERCNIQDIITDRRELVIHGLLCDAHRVILSKLRRVQIVLKDDLCYNLQHCM